jgi:prophage endopeptidase
MTIPPVRLLLLLVLASLIGWVAFDHIADQRDAAVASTATAISERDAVQGELDGLKAANELRDRQLQARDALDQKRTQELSDAYKNIADLRLAVASGANGLRVRASCPASVPAPSSGAGAAGLADAGTAELAADARPDYFTLLEQLALSEKMILGLQDYAHQVCQQKAAP